MTIAEKKTNANAKHGRFHKKKIKFNENFERRGKINMDLNLGYTYGQLEINDDTRKYGKFSFISGKLNGFDRYKKESTD